MKTNNEIIEFIAEYAYYMANPKTKMDVPSIVYEQVGKDYLKFLGGEDVIARLRERQKKLSDPIK